MKKATRKSDATRELMGAVAQWLEVALEKATPAGRRLANQSLTRPDTDLAVVIALKAGKAILYSTAADREAVEVAKAVLPPLAKHEGVAAEGSDALH